jgi:hypothetical protein
MKRIVAFLVASTMLAGVIFYLTTRPAEAHLPPPVPPDDAEILIPPVTWGREDTINGVSCIQEVQTGVYEYIGGPPALRVYALSNHWASCTLENTSDRLHLMHVEGWTWVNQPISLSTKPLTYTAYDIWPCSGGASGIPENCPYRDNVWRWTWDFSTTDEAIVAWGITRATVLIERLQHDGTWRLIPVTFPPLIPDEPTGSIGRGRSDPRDNHDSTLHPSGYEARFQGGGTGFSSRTFGFDLMSDNLIGATVQLGIDLVVTDPDSLCLQVSLGTSCWLGLSGPPTLLTGEADGVGEGDLELLPYPAPSDSFTITMHGSPVIWEEGSSFTILFYALSNAVADPVMIDRIWVDPVPPGPASISTIDAPMVLWDAHGMHTQGPLAWTSFYQLFLPMILNH